jgi:hypothetical protein
MQTWDNNALFFRAILELERALKGKRLSWMETSLYAPDETTAGLQVNKFEELRAAWESLWVAKCQDGCWFNGPRMRNDVSPDSFFIMNFISIELLLVLIMCHWSLPKM